MIITWRVKDIPEKIPSLFVECMMTVSNTIHIPSVFNKAKSNLPILREYYKRLTGIASIQDLVSRLKRLFHASSQNVLDVILSLLKLLYCVR